MYWLFKEEPSHYSYDDLVREGKTSLTGVHNNLALKYLRSVKKDDVIFYYHTGSERQIVGTMKALSDAYATDGKEILTSKEIAVDVAPLDRLAHPVTLEQIKRERKKNFADFLLLKI